MPTLETLSALSYTNLLLKHTTGSNIGRLRYENGVLAAAKAHIKMILWPAGKDMKVCIVGAVLYQTKEQSAIQVIR